MQKKYSIENLGCANCAAKMEAKMNDLPQVEQAVITFATRQLTVTAQDPDALLPQLQSIVSSIESDARIVSHSHVHSGEHCGCGHCREHEAHCHSDHHHGERHHGDRLHKEEEGIVPLLIGAGVFVWGLVLDGLGVGLSGVPVSLAAYIASYLVLGLPVLKTAAGNLIRGHVFDENFLMSIATLGAFAIREFPEAVGVMLFYRVGEFFEHRAVERSRSQIMRTLDLRPETVQLASGAVIPAEDAAVGDLLLVRPGDRIPLDATVVSGESRIDTAPITGEPVPVRAVPGSSVISGCVNINAPLTLRVEKVLSESMVSRILDAVENAAAGKPRIDRFITRFARVYTPIVVALAVATAVIPSLVIGDWDYWVYTALSFLVMSCPCALVLSVPLAFFSGIGVGSKRGILFKGGLSMEALAGIKAVALDKTGTVTKGDFAVRRCVGPEELLSACAACEQYSTHPIAVSIMEEARKRGLSLSQPQALEEIPGQGIRAKLEGREVLCGNARLLLRFGVEVPETPGAVLVAVDGSFMGYIVVADALKPGAKEAVRALHDMGLATAMLTGDSEPSAREMAKEAGISQVHAGLLPQDKLAVLGVLREEKGPVMFVGDGINDAPVLSGADVGAAMGSGADAAIEAADVVFMTDHVAAVPEAIAIARRTRAIAWQNVIFALGIKVIVMVLGLLGFANMWLAVFADSGVAMLCVLNAIRLLYKK